MRRPGRACVVMGQRPGSRSQKVGVDNGTGRMYGFALRQIDEGYFVICLQGVKYVDMAKKQQLVEIGVTF